MAVDPHSPKSGGKPGGGKLLGRLMAFARRPPVEGFVDRVVAGEVHGWAFDPSRPDRRLLVVATLDGTIQAETLADLPRKDLEAAGKGDGKHGFRLRLPAVAAGAEVQIQVMIGSHRHPLQRGAVTLPPTSTPARPEPAAEPRPATVGFLESCRKGALKGWAVNPNNPEEPALVDLFDGERYLGSVQATVERPRLHSAGAPRGARGFVFRAPEGWDLNGGAAVRARIAGSRLELRRSKGYPGTDPAGGEPSDDDDQDGRAAPAPAAAEASEGAVLLLCLGPQTDKRRLAIDAVGRERITPYWLDGAGSGDLRQAIASAEFAVLLGPDQEPHERQLAALAKASLLADVFVWGERRGARGDPRLQALLRPEPGPLAIRSRALLAFTDEIETLCRQGCAPVARQAALTPGLRWERLAPGTAPAGIAVDRTPPQPPVQPPRRISLAVWSGWGPEPPPALRWLLAQASGFEIEVLTPVSTEIGAWEAALRQDAGAQAAALTLRPVDDLNESATPPWRALASAASGEVLILCHGEVAPETETVLSEVSAWALAPGVGVVTVALTDGDAVVAGLDLSEGAREGVFRPAEADQAEVVGCAPLAFLAVSRRRLVDAGGFDNLADPAAADVELALRLKRRGLSCLALGRQSVRIGEEALSPWRVRSVPISLRARYGPELAALAGADAG